MGGGGHQLLAHDELQSDPMFETLYTAVIYESLSLQFVRQHIVHIVHIYTWLSQYESAHDCV